MRDILIVIPVYNAYEYFVRCLTSVMSTLDDHARVLVIDDASTDSRLRPGCDQVLVQERVERRWQLRNKGFVRTANSGMRSARDRGEHCLLLNSDTIVTQGWLDRMRACLDSHEGIGFVSPLSNAATIYSVPSPHERPLPAEHTPDTMAEIVARVSERCYPRAPTGHGFCMLIRHEAMAETGMLDEAFGRGYGEEVDYCLRAATRGWQCAICDDAYVYHATGASFGAEGKAISPARQKNTELIRTRWPHYERDVRAHNLLDPLRTLRYRIYRDLGAPASAQKARPRVLQIVHTCGSNGGTELHTEELTGYLRSKGCDARILTPRATLERQQLDHVHLFNAATVPPLPVIYGARAAHSSALVARALRETITGLGAQIVHVQHPLGYGLLNIPRVVHEAGAKCVVSIHDYYYLCPRYNLAGADASPCGRRALGVCNQCYDCIGGSFASYAAFADYTVQRDYAARTALYSADAIITVSDFSRDMIVKAYSIPQQHVRVIRYGFDLSPGSVRRTARGQRLRVTVLGNLTPIKGLHDVEQSARALAPLSAGIRLTVRGGVPPGVTSIKATPYQHKDLARIMSNTDVVLIASRVAETFCRTLDEALYCGVPVVAPRIGAIPERLKHGVNGLLFEPGDWCGALACLKELSADRPLLAHLVEGARAYKRRTPDACHAEYEQIYNDLLSRS